MQFSVQVPEFLSEEQRKEVGQQIIKTIQERTLQGRNLDGSAFHPYSPRYVNSKEFRLAGKSAKDVNLRFTEEMLTSLVVTKTGAGTVTIGFDSDYAAQKAQWAEAGDNGPSRRFFGVTPDELSSILETYQAPDNLPSGLGESILARLVRLF